MTKEEIVKHLEYIANSPSEANGGFSEQTIYIARQTIQYIESKDSELESARKNYDELLDEINEEYSKSAALKKIIEEREVELASAKDEIDRLVSRCDTYYAKLEEQQKQLYPATIKKLTIEKPFDEPVEGKDEV